MNGQPIYFNPTTKQHYYLEPAKPLTAEQTLPKADQQSIEAFNSYKQFSDIAMVQAGLRGNLMLANRIFNGVINAGHTSGVIPWQNMQSYAHAAGMVQGNAPKEIPVRQRTDGSWEPVSQVVAQEPRDEKYELLAKEFQSLKSMLVDFVNKDKPEEPAEPPKGD